MANQPPAGRWMRMATIRPMPVPAQEPASPPPPTAPARPLLGRAFAAAPFRPLVPVLPTPAPAPAPAPAAAAPTSSVPVLAPPRQATTIRPPSVRPAAGNGGVPTQQGAPSAAAPGTNGVPSPLRALNALAETTRVPSPQPSPNAGRLPSPQPAPSAGLLSSPQQAPDVAAANGERYPPLRAPPPSITAIPPPSPPKVQVAPTASPVPQTSPMLARNGQGSPKLSTPPPTTTTHPPSPISTAPPPSTPPSLKTVSPSPQKQAVTSSPKFASAPAPRMVTFSDVRTLPSPAKSPVSPAPAAATTPPKTTKSPLYTSTPPQSGQSMSLAPPPSPLRLPPPQLRSDSDQEPKIPLEPEQKSVLFQQTLDKTKPSSTDSYEKPLTDSVKAPHIIKHDNDTKEKERYPHKKHPDSDIIGRSIITIAGENRGALMDLGRPRTTHPPFPGKGNPHKLTSPDPKTNGSESNQSSGSNGKPKMKDAIPAPPMKAFVNSNVQGINNSLMFNSTVSHHDPGIHVALSRKHKGQGSLIRHYRDNGNGPQN